MADVNSLISVGLPWAVAQEITEASPDKDVLIAYGVAPELATEIASGSATVNSLMALGMPALVAEEVFAELND